jgi:hypothetical protein
MSWYQCSCGFVTEMMPRFGDELVSIMHVHRSARLDGTSALVSMVEIQEPVAASPHNSDRGNQRLRFADGYASPSKGATGRRIG